MSDAAPRVAGSELGKMIGSTVRIVARFEESNGTVARMLTADNVTVQVALIPQSILRTQSMYEIIGRVQPDGTVMEMMSTPLGDNFDVALYADLLRVIPQVQEMFR